jgi:hypothetical protein
VEEVASFKCAVKVNKRETLFWLVNLIGLKHSGNELIDRWKILIFITKK